MKRWTIYTIISVLTLALLGLVYVQSIYIKRGLFIQNQLFDQVVNEALMHTAVHVEQVQAYNYFNSQDNMNKMFSNLPSFNNMYEGFSLNYENGNYAASIERNDTLFTFEATTIHSLDSIIAKASCEMGGFNEFQGDPINNSEQYNQLVQNMAVQFMYGQPKQDLFVDSAEIGEILGFELDRSGINTNFEFAVLDGYTLKKIMSSYDKLNNAIIRSSYKTNINLNSMGDQLLLLVNFPNKNSFIFQSNKMLLGSSFLFVLLIAASFAGSIFIIFKQKKLSELKTDFINNMTHELKTPVATISLATEMLGKEKVMMDKARVKNYTTIINDENKRLGSHIERVLQIAQLDRENVKLKKEPLSVQGILNDVLQNYKLRIDSEQAKVTTNLESEEDIIYGDKTHIANMFSNLIDNALKYRREVPIEINVRSYNEGDDICVSVTDNGIGMSDANQKKIFTQFYRVPTGNIHNVKGFGLGLSYVKSMVDAHKGTISVDSELGKYTTFTIRLPYKN